MQSKNITLKVIKQAVASLLSMAVQNLECRQESQDNGSMESESRMHAFNIMFSWSSLDIMTNINSLANVFHSH